MTRVDRTSMLVRAIRLRSPEIDPDRILRVLAAVLDGVTAETVVEPCDDRTFVRVVALTLAFYEEVREAMNGEVELNAEEESMLESILAYLRRDGA